MKTIDKLKKYCESFYGSHYLPLSIIDDEEKITYTFSPFEHLDTIIKREIKIFDHEKYPKIINTNDIGLFGIIKARGSRYYYIVGPAISIAPNQNDVYNYGKKLSLNQEHIDQLSVFIYTISKYTYNQFVNLVAFLEFSLNNRFVSVAELEGFDLKLGDEIQKTEVVNKMTNEHQEHGTYFFEKKLLSCIKDGDITKLNLLFEEASKGQRVTEGVVGNNELRQAKNICIGLLSIVGKTAAIDGGLDIEEAYDLIDLYSIECEKCLMVSQIKNLQYNALVDFTTRVNTSKPLLQFSNDVANAIGYIKKNIGKIKEVMDVVSYIGVSRTSLLTRFKKEVGETLGSYINKQKIKEAQLLLIYSTKSLLEISLSLNYSSQSYFQNRFKQTINMTPKEYRISKT